MNVSELKFLLKHSSIYGIGTVVSQAVGFLLLPLYTRFLTPSDYGVLSLINITKDIIGLIVTLGIVNAMSRFYFDFEDEKGRNRVVSTIFWIFVFTSIVFIPVLYLLSSTFSGLIFHTAEYRNYFIVAFLALFFGAAVDIGLSYLRIKAQSFRYVQVSIFRTLMLIGFNIYFIAFAKIGVIGIFYSSLITMVVFSFILLVPILSRVKLHFSFELASEMVKYSFPLVFSNMFRIMVNQSDKFFINYFFSTFETGIYSIAQKIGQSIHSLITSPFIQTYLPRRFEIMRRKDAKQVYASVLNYYLLVIGSVGLLLSIFAPEIIKLMTTEKFYAASKYIPLVVLSMIIFGMKYHFEIGILIKKQTKYSAVINGIGAFLNITLNYFLISHFRLWGALVASNISIFTTSFLNFAFSHKLYKIDYQFKIVLKIFFLIISFYVLSLTINFDDIFYNMIFKGTLFLVYLLTIVPFGIIEKEMLKLVKNRIYEFVKASPAE